MAEGLTEEELALFDILTKPEPKLTKKEEAEVKAACPELLALLKRDKQQTRAGLKQAIKLELRRLPAS